MPDDPFALLRDLEFTEPPCPDPDCDHEECGEPLIKPITGFEAYMINKYWPQS
jgi:hypothetical protein